MQASLACTGLARGLCGPLQICAGACADLCRTCAGACVGACADLAEPWAGGLVQGTLRPLQICARACAGAGQGLGRTFAELLCAPCSLPDLCGVCQTLTRWNLARTFCRPFLNHNRILWDIGKTCCTGSTSDAQQCKATSPLLPYIPLCRAKGCAGHLQDQADMERTKQAAKKAERQAAHSKEG